MITVPDDFATGVVNQAGAAGRAWIERLPLLVASLCTEWDLTIDGAPMHGYLGLVVPVTQRAMPRMLKVSWMDESNAHEVVALSLWNGQGAVQLLAADSARGAMLLERLDERHSLHDVDIGRAVPIVGHLLRRLSIPIPSTSRLSTPTLSATTRPGSAPPTFPLLKDVAGHLVETLPDRWERMNRPLPRRFVDIARDAAIHLGPAAGTLIVNYDLHYGNVLAGNREPWLVIDPKLVVGDPEYGLAQLLWTRLEDMNRAGGLSHHYHSLVEHADLDLRRTQAWTVVRCVDYWLWALSVGLTEDPLRCEAITTWLAS